MRVTVEVRGADQAASLLERIGRRANGRLVLRGLLDDIMAVQRERYEGKGVRWRKLAASTLATDRRQGRDPRPLIASGELMRSLTVPGHPEQVVKVRPGELRFGTSVFYARFHHKGQGGMPKRAVVGFSRVHRKRLIDELKDRIFSG